MVLTTIYLTRHGFRVNWTIDPRTGTYFTNIPSPTDIPSDPPLAAYGVKQAEELADALVAIKDPPISRVYSSPFYRCLQTLQPFVKKSGLDIKGDNGLGEWYGLARFTHPSPATPSVLHGLFPSYSPHHKPSIIPSTSGETVSQLHDRCAYALNSLISAVDAEDAKIEPERESAILICTHAAPMIAIGRALTGRMPDDICVPDFKTYTCAISKFVRKTLKQAETESVETWDKSKDIPIIRWNRGKGVAGGWDCMMNGDCGHLDGGEERGWYFNGDEAFDDTKAILNEYECGKVDSYRSKKELNSKL